MMVVKNQNKLHFWTFLSERNILIKFKLVRNNGKFIFIKKRSKKKASIKIRYLSR